MHNNFDGFHLIYTTITLLDNFRRLFSTIYDIYAGIRTSKSAHRQTFTIHTVHHITMIVSLHRHIPYTLYCGSSSLINSLAALARRKRHLFLSSTMVPGNKVIKISKCSRGKYRRQNSAAESGAYNSIGSLLAGRQ